MAYIIEILSKQRGVVIMDSLINCSKTIQRGVGSFLYRNSFRMKASIALLTGMASVIYVVKKSTKIDWRYVFFQTNLGNKIYSFIIDRFSDEIAQDERQVFKDLEVDIQHANPRAHSHPVAAKNRCRANTLMEHAALMLGRRSYHYQMSPTQNRLKLAGSRTIYTAKDLQMRYQFDNVSKDDVILLTDVDYYLDITGLLRGNLVMIYTFVPLEVAGVVNDGVYCTHEDDTVETLHSGGSKYKHLLWDYDNDHLVVDVWNGSYIYLIEQINIDHNHRIIFLNPVRFVYGPFGWILPGQRMRRRKFNIDGVVYSKFNKAIDSVVSVWHSLALAGQHVACTISSDTFHATYIRLSENKDPHLSDVERYFNTYKVDNALFASSLFYHIFRNKPQVFNANPEMITTCIQLPDRHTYQAVGPLVSEDGHPTMRALWPGYTSNAFSPAKSFNNDVACVKGRITDVRNTKPQLPPMYYTFLIEFVEQLVPNSLKHTLSPSHFEDMWDKFDRPTQRALLAQADFTMDSHVGVRSFQKREAYGKITAPRNISTLPMSHNCSLGQFTLPLLEHVIKKTHWYAFGKHPTLTSQILHNKASNKSFAICSDYNKLDGSAGHPIFRDLFVAIMRSAFHPRYHAEIVKLENRERYAKCRTTFGLKYNADHTILSGSSMTSLLGTVINAFVMYVALRLTHSKIDAWNALGIYGGDDGVSFDILPEHVSRTAAKFGLLCEVEKIEAGLPVKFLGRIYVDPWTNDQSIADVARQMSKIHLTTANITVPDWLCLYRKAVGYLVTDPNTPLMSVWARSVIRLVSHLEPEKHRLYQLTIGDQQYWSKFEHPFIAPTNNELTYDIVSRSLNITITRLVTLEHVFRNAKSLRELFLVDIFDVPAKCNLDAVLKGEVHKASKTEDVQARILRNRRLNIKTVPDRECRFSRRKQPCPYVGCKFEHRYKKVNK
nr:MAG: hypothetical protein 1 [Sichuan sediment noda-like virus 13]